MKREIKFRGKSLNARTWVYGDLQHKGKRAFVEYEVAPETVGQFIGLTDKNGKEIYEGDVICERLPNEIATSWIVRYDVGMSEYRATNPQDECDDVELNAIYLNDAEIIGNIHDNPELLKTNSNEQDKR